MEEVGSPEEGGKEQVDRNIMSFWACSLATPTEGNHQPNYNDLVSPYIDDPYEFQLPTPPEYNNNTITPPLPTSTSTLLLPPSTCTTSSRVLSPLVQDSVYSFLRSNTDFFTRHSMRIRILPLPLRYPPWMATKSLPGVLTCLTTEMPPYTVLWRHREFMRLRLMSNWSYVVTPTNPGHHPRNQFSPFVLNDQHHRLENHVNSVLEDLDEPDFKGALITIHTKIFASILDNRPIGLSKVVGGALMEQLADGDVTVKTCWIHCGISPRATRRILAAFLPRLLVEAFGMQAETNTTTTPPSPTHHNKTLKTDKAADDQENKGKKEKEEKETAVAAESSSSSSSPRFAYIYVDNLDYWPRQCYILLQVTKWMGLFSHYELLTTTTQSQPPHRDVPPLPQLWADTPPIVPPDKNNNDDGHYSSQPSTGDGPIPQLLPTDSSPKHKRLEESGEDNQPNQPHKTGEDKKKPIAEDHHTNKKNTTGLGDRKRSRRPSSTIVPPSTGGPQPPPSDSYKSILVQRGASCQCWDAISRHPRQQTDALRLTGCTEDFALRVLLLGHLQFHKDNKHLAELAITGFNQEEIISLSDKNAGWRMWDQQNKDQDLETEITGLISVDADELYERLKEHPGAKRHSAAERDFYEKCKEDEWCDCSEDEVTRVHEDTARKEAMRKFKRNKKT